MTDQLFYTSAAGNSFLLSFDMNASFEALKGYALAGGYKPDGYILFDDINESYFEWRFLNNDGSEVDFCGNALRAVGVCAKQAFGFDEININTLAGMFEVKALSDNEFKAQMPTPSLRKKIKVEGFGETLLVDAGVPHLLLKVGQFDQEVLNKSALSIRGLKLEDDAQNYNLTFYTEGSPVPCVTFERGVEGFTKACGSGALAVAFLKSFEADQKMDVDLKMPGGTLKVNYEGESVFMTGPAQIDKTIK